MNYSLLQELSLLNRDNIFKDQPRICFDKFSNRLGKIEQDPFIGFVGKDFINADIKVLFLGKSNAESAAEHYVTDKGINRALSSFRLATDDLENSYRKYANRYLEAMPRWNIMRFVTEFRNQTRLNLNQIAYANIVPYRYKGAPNNAAYELAFRNYTNKFISIIEPDQIIPLGANLEHLVAKNLITNHHLHISQGINREGRDKRIAESGWETISSAVSDYKMIQKYPNATKSALDWVNKNKWFEDPNASRATLIAQMAHISLTNMGVDTDSAEYYSAIDVAVRKFGHH